MGTLATYPAIATLLATSPRCQQILLASGASGTVMPTLSMASGVLNTTLWSLTNTRLRAHFIHAMEDLATGETVTEAAVKTTLSGQTQTCFAQRTDAQSTPTGPSPSPIARALDMQTSGLVRTVVRPPSTSARIMATTPI